MQPLLQLMLAWLLQVSVQQNLYQPKHIEIDTVSTLHVIYNGYTQYTAELNHGALHILKNSVRSLDLIMSLCIKVWSQTKIEDDLVTF